MSEQGWQPGATLETIKLRARLRQRIRAFFDERGVVEVDTPLLAPTGSTDLHIDSMTTHSGVAGDPMLYLQTSPEYAMKRLLAAGSGSIYQLDKVFRYGERGKQHHPEFTLLEWYRVGFDHFQLIDEVDDLLRKLLADSLALAPSLKWSYLQAWCETIQLDPFTASLQQLEGFARRQHIDMVNSIDERDDWLHLIMSYCVEPRLPTGRPVFIYDYPASQAALARIRHDDIAVAERFELYLNGLELANGFHELTDAIEQRSRFQQDNARREQAGKALVPLDEKLLAALSQVPDCAGVALGFDRLMMLASGLDDISQVLCLESV